MSLIAIQIGCVQQSGFECGVMLESQPDVVRRCDRPNEVCVCATHACAFAVPTEDCESGFQYVKEPFAGEDLAEACVNKRDSAAVIDQRADLLCPVDYLDDVADGSVEPDAGSTDPDASSSADGVL